MPNNKKNTDTAQFNPLNPSTFTAAAFFYINKSDITSISELMSFLRDQNNVVKLPNNVLNEYLEVIKDVDPVFVASFKSIYTETSTSNKPSSSKTFLSVLSLNEDILKLLESVGIYFVEDFIENLEKTEPYFTFEQLREIFSKIALWNEFLVKESLLLKTPTNNSIPIEHISLQLIGGILSYWKIMTIGDLIIKYPSLYNSKLSQGLANQGKMYIVEQFYRWYSDKNEIDLYNDFRNVTIDLSPINNSFYLGESSEENDNSNFGHKLNEIIQYHKLAMSDVSIDELQISTRLRNSLKRWGIHTIKELKHYSQKSIEKPWTDLKKVSEIRNALKQYDPQKLVDSVNKIIPNEAYEKVVANYRTENEGTKETTHLNQKDYSLIILGLSTRAYNSLVRSGVNTTNELIKIKHQLSNIRGIGSFHATEILKKLSAFLQNEEKDDSIIERSDDLNNILSKIVNEFEFSASTSKKLLKFGLFSIGDVVEYLYGKPSSSPSISKLTYELSQILEKDGFTLMDAFQGLSINSIEINAPQTNTSDTELHKKKYDSEESFTDILMRWFSLIDERQIRIIEKYYGLKSGEKQTLEEISEKEGCTRERIRQIKNHTITKLKKHLVLQEYNLFNPLKEQINERNGIISTTRLSQNLKGELNRRNLVAENFLLFLRDFIKNLEKKPIFYCENLDAWVVKANHIDYSLLVSKNIKNCLNDGEKLSWDELYKKLLSNEGLLTLDSGFALSVANCLKDQGIVEYSLNGLWSLHRKKDRQFYYESALKSIGHPTHYKDLAKVASELAGKNFSDRSANAVLSGNKEIFTRVGRGIYGLLEWGLHKDGSIANAARRILYEAGRPLPLKLLISEIQSEWQVEEFSVISAIDHDRRFERLTDGKIGLTEFGLMDKKYKRRRDQTKKTRLFLVLKDMGEPAYYKDIAKKHNEKYPNKNLTDQKVYQTLMITHDLFIRTGTATYGLVEWGIREFETKKKITRKEQIVTILKSVMHPMRNREIIARINKLYPDWPISSSGLTQALQNNPDVFYRIQDGLYSLKEWHKTG